MPEGYCGAERARTAAALRRVEDGAMWPRSLRIRRPVSVTPPAQELGPLSTG